MGDASGEARGAAVDRRAVLELAGGAAVGAAVGAFASPADAGAQASDIVMMNAVGLARAIQSRKVSCAEVMTAYLDHIETFNPKVNAIVALQDRRDLLRQAGDRDAQLARGEATGPLHGFP